MTRRTGRWTGTDLAPLPYESALSTFWRFGSRNRLSSHELRRLCSTRRTGSQKLAYDDFDWIDTPRFRAASTWNVPSAEEAEFAAGLGKHAAIWTESRIRICPICLEHGYHSFLFQLNLLHDCPIHHLPLSTCCQSCGASLDRYGYAREVLDRPYHCAKCKKSLAGVPLLLTDHLAFRMHAHEIDNALSPLMTWWRKSQTARLDAHALCPPNQIHSSQWCATNAFVQSVVIGKVQPPAIFARPRYERITSFSWKIRMYEDAQYQGWTRRRQTWSIRSSIPSAVYPSTLRLLENWIAENSDISPEDRRQHQFLNWDDGLIEVCKYDARLLAYWLLRYQLERSPYRVNGPSQRAQLHDLPDVVMCLHQERSPRLAWRATFLSLYFAWYYRIVAARRAGCLDLRLIFQEMIGPAFLHSGTCHINGSGQWITGTVAFPTPQGTEIRFFHRRMAGSSAWNR
jgi:hypothetical protein